MRPQNRWQQLAATLFPSLCGSHRVTRGLGCPHFPRLPPDSVTAAGHNGPEPEPHDAGDEPADAAAAHAISATGRAPGRVTRQLHGDHYRST